jgi:SAM-dependent methyltransferase
MADFNAIYDKLRQSEMNAWVGGADPAEVGKICSDILLRHVPVDQSTRLLDFGVGIGRVALAVLQRRPEVQAIAGLDIVPKLVDFCNATIASEFPNTSFELLADQNEHYERFKHEARAKSREEIAKASGDSFDVAYAFSVFTHIDKGDFVSLLKFVRSLLKPGGRFLFTAFILTPFSRATLGLGWTFPPFKDLTFEDDGAVFIGNPEDRLAFIGYDIGRIEAMIFEAGLIPTAIEYGDWRGGSLAQSYQDVIVCRRPLDLKL